MMIDVEQAVLSNGTFTNMIGPFTKIQLFFRLFHGFALQLIVRVVLRFGIYLRIFFTKGLIKW